MFNFYRLSCRRLNPASSFIATIIRAPNSLKKKKIFFKGLGLSLNVFAPCFAQRLLQHRSFIFFLRFFFFKKSLADAGFFNFPIIRQHCLLSSRSFVHVFCYESALNFFFLSPAYFDDSRTHTASPITPILLVLRFFLIKNAVFFPGLGKRSPVLHKFRRPVIAFFTGPHYKRKRSFLLFTHTRLVGSFFPPVLGFFNFLHSYYSFFKNYDASFAFDLQHPYSSLGGGFQYSSGLHQVSALRPPVLDFFRLDNLRCSSFSGFSIFTKNVLSLYLTLSRSLVKARFSSLFVSFLEKNSMPLSFALSTKLIFIKGRPVKFKSASCVYLTRGKRLLSSFKYLKCFFRLSGRYFFEKIFLFLNYTLVQGSNMLSGFLHILFKKFNANMSNKLLGTTKYTRALLPDCSALKRSFDF